MSKTSSLFDMEETESLAEVTQAIQQAKAFAILDSTRETESDLPEGWIQTTLAQVANLITGGTPPRQEKDYYGDVYPWVKPSDLGTDTQIVKTDESLSEKGGKISRIVPIGGVLVCCIGTIGKSGIAGTSLVTNQQINSAVFQKNFIIPKYGYYYLLTQVEWMIENSSATTISILNKSKFGNTPFSFLL